MALQELWNPHTELFFKDPFFRNKSDFDWAPRCDVSEDEKSVTVHADLPGMKKEDISIELRNNVLRIYGERKNQHEEKNEKDGFQVHRMERSYGSFERKFRVPDGLKPEDVSAKVNDGVLEVSFPKTAIPTNSGKIDIK